MHMLAFLFWLIGVLIIVLQTAVLPLLSTPAAIPDLIFIFITFCAYRFSWFAGLFLTFSIGWMFDVVTAADLGFYPIECLLVFAGLKLLTTNSPVRAVVYQLPLVGLGYLFWQILSYALYSFERENYIVELSGSELMSSTILVIVAAIPCFAFYSFLYESVEKRFSSVNPPRRRRPQKIF